MPSTYAGKAVMFANVAAKIGNYDAELGLTAGEVLAIVALCDEYAAVYTYYTQSQAHKQALTQWRDLAFLGDPEGDALPNPPAAPAYNSPGGEVIGMLNVFRAERDRWVAAAGYTQAIGEDLMIVSTAPEGIIPGEVEPTINVFAAQTGYMFSIVVNGREESDSWIVQTRVLPDGGWTNAGTFTGKSADVSVTPPEAATPIQVQVRVQLRKHNANYGQLSQIATVTVNP